MVETIQDSQTLLVWVIEKLLTRTEGSMSSLPGPLQLGRRTWLGSTTLCGRRSSAPLRSAGDGKHGGRMFFAPQGRLQPRNG